MKKFYDINPAVCYLNKEMFVVRKVLPYRSTWPNESLENVLSKISDEEIL